MQCILGVCVCIMALPRQSILLFCYKFPNILIHNIIIYFIIYALVYTYYKRL